VPRLPSFFAARDTIEFVDFSLVEAAKIGSRCATGCCPNGGGKNKSTQGKWDLLKHWSRDGTACQAERMGGEPVNLARRIPADHPLRKLRETLSWISCAKR
jgi:hypothetical protein